MKELLNTLLSFLFDIYLPYLIYFELVFIKNKTFMSKEKDYIQLTLGKEFDNLPILERIKFEKGEPAISIIEKIFKSHKLRKFSYTIYSPDSNYADDPMFNASSKLDGCKLNTSDYEYLLKDGDEIINPEKKR